MTDFYSLLFGREAPGSRARSPMLKYLDGEDSGPGVGLAASRTAFTGAPAAAPPRWAADATAARARDQRRTSEQPRDAYVYGPGGVIDEPLAPTPAPHVPFSAAAGMDSEPFGEDFVTWYETTRGRPLPALLLAPGPDAQTEAFGWGLNTETGQGADAHAPLDIPEGQRGREPETATATDRPHDFWAEWRAAERRAMVRSQAGKPTPTDMFFQLVYGSYGRRQRERED